MTITTLWQLVHFAQAHVQLHTVEIQETKKCSSCHLKNEHNKYGRRIKEEKCYMPAACHPRWVYRSAPVAIKPLWSRTEGYVVSR